MSLEPTKRFSDRADNYEKYRPDYPKEVIEAIQSYISSEKPLIVADIGSGTGKFTKRLLEADFEVFAVEPNDEMRAKADQELQIFPKFHSVKGTAETTTLPDESIDLITAAQAFHWFQIEPTLKEFQRILKVDGLLAYIWNVRDNSSSEFLREYEKALLDFCPDYPKSVHTKIGKEDIVQHIEEISLEEFHFFNSQQFDKEGFFGRVFSSSYTPAPDAPNYASFKQALEVLFEKYQVDGQVVFKYMTDLYLGRIVWFS